MTTCTICGEKNRDGARFCNGCAAPLDGAAAPAGEVRKVASGRDAMA